jgi:hypothetical protein
MNSSRTAAVSDLPDDPAGATLAPDAPIGFRTPGNYSINGRYSLLCSTLGLSARGLELCVMVKPQIGDHIDAIFNTVGRLQGHVCELTRAGVIMALEKEIHAGLREQFAFLADASLDAVRRRHFRVKPRTPETMIRAADRTAYPAYVIDFSISGASIETEAPVGVGEMIDFARFTRAKIVRSFGERRFGVEFQRQFRPQEFSWNIRL